MPERTEKPCPRLVRFASSNFLEDDSSVVHNDLKQRRLIRAVPDLENGELSLKFIALLSEPEELQVINYAKDVRRRNGDPVAR